MKILVVGSGGREHALCWKLAQSRHAERIFCAPGNAGTARIAQNVNIGVEKIGELADFCWSEGIDLTVVGPEAPLVAGIVDEFEKRGLKIFGPEAAAAMIEGSKAFAKEVMKAAGVPTARYVTITDLGQAESALSEFDSAAVKADGLAGGKGVIICRSRPEIIEAVRTLMQEPSFGNSGKKIVVEELLEGEEATVLAFCDGRTAKLMVSSQDHKRILDGDMGKNTGGMGAYAPATVVSGMDRRIHDEIFVPVLKEMEKRGTQYKGVLYAGLMIKDGKFNVLEFNARFGDPEAQPVLSLLESDLVDIAQACMDGRLDRTEVRWKDRASCCVVMASGGYPEKYEKGKEITGIEDADKIRNVKVFQSGTRLEGSSILTDGGRVLGVTGTGYSIEEAIGNAYLGVSKIRFDGMYFRKDIGRRALERVKIDGQGSHKI